MRANSYLASHEVPYSLWHPRVHHCVFHTEINLKLERIETVVLSGCVLRNFLHWSCNSYAADVQNESEVIF